MATKAPVRPRPASAPEAARNAPDDRRDAPSPTVESDRDWKETARRLWLWPVAILLSLPIGGFIANLVINGVDSVGTALAGGLIAGSIIGAAGWYVLRRRISWLWIPATAVGMAVGLAGGAALVDYGIARGDVVLMGAVTGLGVGVLQALVLARHKIPNAWWWAVANPPACALGWLVTSYVITTNVKEQFPIFGGSGAIVFGLLTWFVLALLFRGRRSSTPNTMHATVEAKPGSRRRSSAAQDSGHVRSFRADPNSTGRIGWIVAGSLGTGLLVGLLLVAAPFIPAEETQVTGVLLCGFALGWAMLAVLSVRFSDQPQRWAAAPALFIGLGGLLLVGFGSGVQDVLSWVWPPALLALVVWMIVGAHRQLRSRSRRWLLYPVAAMMALAAVGGGAETVRAALDQDLSMPGQLIDVGGHSLHLNCSGSGSPTVVLEPGAGAMSSDLAWITPAVARDTRVCVYDRAGRGWSEPADTSQDGAQIATDLHTLLERGGVPGPYVMAGHSFGGLYVLAFAARYPDEVAGMVLVDSARAGIGTKWRHRPATRAPTTSRGVPPHCFRPQPDWVCGACSAKAP